MVKLAKSDARGAETSRRSRPGHAKRFDGALNEPIVRKLGLAPVAAPLPSSQETAEERFRRLLGPDDVVRALRLLKLDKLLKDYRLPDSPRDFPSLALCLAIEFVPGMAHLAARPRGPGRAPERKKYELVEAVEAARRKNPKISVLAACERLTKTPGPWKGSNAATMRTAYHRTKRELEALISSGFLDAP